MNEKRANAKTTPKVEKTLTIDCDRVVTPARVQSLIRDLCLSKGDTVVVECTGRGLGPRTDKAIAIATRMIDAQGCTALIAELA